MRRGGRCQQLVGFLPIRGQMRALHPPRHFAHGPPGPTRAGPLCVHPAEQGATLGRLRPLAALRGGSRRAGSQRGRGAAKRESVSRLQRLALLLAVLVTALFVTTTSLASPASQAETRVWDFWCAAGGCVGAERLEVPGMRQGNELAAYDFASDSSVAAEGLGQGKHSWASSPTTSMSPMIWPRDVSASRRRSGTR